MAMDVKVNDQEKTNTLNKLLKGKDVPELLAICQFIHGRLPGGSCARSFFESYCDGRGIDIKYVRRFE